MLCLYIFSQHVPTLVFALGLLPSRIYGRRIQSTVVRNKETYLNQILYDSSERSIDEISAKISSKSPKALRTALFVRSPPIIAQQRDVRVQCSAMSADMSSAPMLCTPGSLASHIEQAICRVYGAEGTGRVRLSVKRLNDGQKLDRVIDASNEMMVQQANSYVEDLTPLPFYNVSHHNWARKLADKWTIVRDELQAVLAHKEKSAKVSNLWGSLDEAILEYGLGWKTLPLCDRTVWDPVNSAIFPNTCALLHESKVPLIEAFFAKMEPNSEIRPHSDLCNFVLTSHLGLVVPEGKCDLTVGNITQEWRNGQVMMFDTSILHSAENRADTARYILMLRVYHPELTSLERSAMQLVFDCLDDSDLIFDNEALAEYEIRRRAVEAESRKAWENILQVPVGKPKTPRKDGGDARKGKKNKKRSR